MPTELNVLVLAGGTSAEHSISLRSAATVTTALQAYGHATTVVAIDKSGGWLAGDFASLLLGSRTRLVEVKTGGGRPVVLSGRQGRGYLLPEDGGDNTSGPFDVVFPVLHGPGGEDGSIQGLLETLAVPFVGAGCRASALAMDKLSAKRLARAIGLEQAEFVDASLMDSDRLTAAVETAFGFPCFVKPASLGSSVGISRVTSPTGLAGALVEARRWDNRIIAERAIEGREIEIALLGNEDPEISDPGEIIPHGDFYDFDDKYRGSEARLIVPADIDPATGAVVYDVARKAWNMIGCRGMARIDFFIEAATSKVLLNEINTIPGFTEISMFPRVWKAAGLGIEDLVAQLVELALQAHPPRR